MLTERVLVIVAFSFLSIHAIKCASQPGASQEVSQNAANPKDMEDTFSDVEMRLRKFVNLAVKLALPHLVKAASVINLSGDCYNSVIRLIGGLKRLDDWAVRMLDASGKPAGGLLEGMSVALGDYDECLNIVVKRNSRVATDNPEELFTGKYCMVEVNFPQAILKAAEDYYSANRSSSPLSRTKTFLKVFSKLGAGSIKSFFRIGVCIPSKCTTEDLQQVVQHAVGDSRIEAEAFRCELKSDYHVNLEQMIVMGVCGSIILVVIIGTALDTYLQLFQESNKTTESTAVRNRTVRFLIHCSVYTNTSNLAQRDPTDEGLGIVRGLRVFTVIGIVLCHTYFLPHPFHFLRYRSVFNYFKFADTVSFGTIANAAVCTDTLFFIGGLTTTYPIWRKAGKIMAKRSILRFVFSQYIRITLVQLLAIALLILLPLMGSGPIWVDFVDSVVENCKNKWWTNVLAVNNFWASEDACIYPAWMLAVLVQFYIVSIIIVWTLSRWPSLGVFICIFLTVSTAAAIAVITILKDLPAAVASYLMNGKTSYFLWNSVFIQSYTHLGPYCIGLLMGYYIPTHPHVKLNQVSATVGWIIAGVSNLAVMYGLYNYRDGEPMDSVLTTLYASIHRSAWALGIAWIVFASNRGYGGIVNDILSWRALVPLDRLGCLAYLLQVHVMYYHGGIQRERLYMGHMEQVLLFLGYTMITLILSYICYILFQAPYHSLERLFSETCRVSLCRQNQSKTTNNAKKTEDESIPHSISISEGLQQGDLYYEITEGATIRKDR